MKVIFEYSEEFNGSIEITGSDNLEYGLSLKADAFTDSDIPNEVAGLHLPRNVAIQLANLILSHYEGI